jgi:hypothetical protein
VLEICFYFILFYLFIFFFFLPGSPWRDRISLAILELQEKGVIPMFYNKWWKNSGDTCNKRQDRDKESKASALGVDNIGTHSIFPNLHTIWHRIVILQSTVLLVLGTADKEIG